MKTESNPRPATLPMLGVLALIVLVIAIIATTHPVAAQTSTQAAPATAAGRDAEIETLKKEIEVLKGKVPDQSHAMKDVAYHFTNLWFAGQKENWPLAKFYCDETRAHLKWAVRIIPVRKVKAGDLDLRPLLDAVDQSVFAALQKVIDAKNAGDFPNTYRQAMGGCYSCHVAAEKPFLRLRVPEQPEARVIEFTPTE